MLLNPYPGRKTRVHPAKLNGRFRTVKLEDTGQISRRKTIHMSALLTSECGSVTFAVLELKSMELRIQKLINLAGWKAMEVPSTRDFTKVTECPCCTFTLAVLATLANAADGANEERQYIRIGCCDGCGFVTMMDKPSHQWVIDFYASTWRQEEDTATTLKKLNTSKSKLLPILKELGIAKNERILEIGTGRGGNFAVLKKEGYGNLFGVENSKHRGQQVASALNVSIFIGGFEQEQVQNSLRANGPYRVIYTSHVVEHVYDPGETIALSASLQREGDYLIIAVPNFIGEPSVGVLAFLPHLHSFTKHAMVALLARKGYRVVDETKTTNEEVLVIARKDGSTNAPLISSNQFLPEARKKIENELRLGEIPCEKSVYYFFSRKKSNETSVEKRNNWVSPFMDKVYGVKCRRKNTRSFVVSKKECTEPFLTISFQNSINLFYK